MPDSENPAPPIGQSHDQADALSLCGKGVISYVDPEDDTLVFIPTRCHRWDCKTCGPYREADTRDRARAGKPTKLLTLTTRPDQWPELADAVDNTRLAYRRLVQRIRRVFGPFEWFCALELTKKGAVHLHILLRCSYMPQPWLSEAWSSLTGNYIVHITKIDKVPQAIGEVTKYLIKSASQVQAACPGRPVYTMSRDWLPEGYDDEKSDTPLDVKPVFLNLTLDEYRDIIHDMGGELVPVEARPHAFALKWLRPPSFTDFLSYLKIAAWPTVVAVAWLLFHYSGPEFPGQGFDDLLDDLSFAKFGDRSHRRQYLDQALGD